MSGVNMISMNICSKTSGFRMTKHALERSQNRCIPPLIIHWFCWSPINMTLTEYAYGSRKRSNNGTIIYYFDRTSTRLLLSDVGTIVIQRLSSLMSVYLVTAGDQIITAGQRYKRIKNL
jgi:hypothetical protein